MYTQLIPKEEKKLRKIFGEDKDHHFDWPVVIENHKYIFRRGRGDFSVHELAELIGKFIQADGYDYERLDKHEDWCDQTCDCNVP